MTYYGSISIFSFRAFSAARNSMTAVAEGRASSSFSFSKRIFVASETEYEVLFFLSDFGFRPIIKLANYLVSLFFQITTFLSNWRDKIPQSLVFGNSRVRISKNVAK